MKLEIILTDEEVQKFVDETLLIAAKKVLRNDEQIRESIVKTQDREVSRKVTSLFEKLKKDLEEQVKNQLGKGVKDILRKVESDIRKDIDFSVFTTSSVMESLKEEAGYRKTRKKS